MSLDLWDFCLIRIFSFSGDELTSCFTLDPASGNWHVHWSLTRGPARVASGEAPFQGTLFFDPSKFRKSGPFSCLHHSDSNCNFMIADSTQAFFEVGLVGIRQLNLGIARF